MTEFKGHLVLVVGPSGAGKDSVLRGARQELAGDRRFVFPRRFVTRFADVSAEDHFTMTDMEFAIAVSEDAFSLWWEAHGNFYGIGKSIEADLKAGCVVAVNCSRAMLDQAAAQYPNVTVAEITASPGVLVSRIVARGRETEAEAIQRVSRSVPVYPAGLQIVRIENNGALQDAVDRFCDILEALENAVSNPGGCALDNQDKQEDGDDDGRGLVIVEHLERHL
ncbi:phosphonate metabolism protein/1,5-bisphosphokinase (PRPP-forming) PhnN [Aestuariivirga sp.]|uniref:phosphonate metabolism protein/1,5-bisphosphokinase (PRPP-forming) PhnN n=1 Tax=Aestuariivirga sp. TaxID=2650926 RepID=UPI003593FACD